MNMNWPDASHKADDVALRGTKRDSMFLKAALYCRRTDHWFDIVVRNVSAGGLLADTMQDLALGESILVTLRHVGDVPGTVVWTQPGRFGIAFDVLIDPAAVRKTVKVSSRSAKSPVSKPHWPRAKPFL